MLYVLSLKYCINAQEAEDNLQESFLTIFKTIKKYGNQGSFEGWMKRITINKAIDRYKNKALFHVVINEETHGDLDSSETLVTSQFKALSLDIILHYVQRLPNRYRLVFNMYELDDYSHKEISQLLNISVNTSKSNLHRAKAILKEALIKEGLTHKKKQLL